jgi:hypothetical protein
MSFPLPTPEPTPAPRDAMFEQLKADVLAGMASLDAGKGVSREEMRAMFKLDEEAPGE